MNNELKPDFGDSRSPIEPRMRSQSGYTEGKIVAHNAVSIFFDMLKPGCTFELEVGEIINNKNLRNRSTIVLIRWRCHHRRYGKQKDNCNLGNRVDVSSVQQASSHRTA